MTVPVCLMNPAVLRRELAGNVGTTIRRREELQLPSTLARQERRLAGDPPAVTAQLPITTYDAVAGDEHGDPVARAGPRHGPRGGRPAELGRNRLV